MPQIPGPTLIWGLDATDATLQLQKDAKTIATRQGQVEDWNLYNPDATSCYLKIYNNAAADVTEATDIPDDEYELKQGYNSPPANYRPKHMSNKAGFSVAVTLNPGADNTAPTQDITIGYVSYKKEGGGLV